MSSSGTHRCDYWIPQKKSKQTNKKNNASLYNGNEKASRSKVKY